MFGLLNIDKPSGCTSRDVVNRIGKLAGRRVKVGHAGTLDPLAEGVLIVCLGPATRLVPFIHEHSKTYRGSFRLGLTSDTEDITGNVTAVECPGDITADRLRDVLPGFLGTISQTPPAYSAAKVAGQRAYDLARQGADVELAPREVHVHRINLVDCHFPDFTLEIECGTGTYVRSLGRDIARRLGTEAVMTALQRTRIGPFHVDEAVTLEELAAENLSDFVLPPQAALPQLEKIAIDDAQLAALRQGRSLPANEPPVRSDGERCAAVDPRGRLAAICQQRGGRWHPVLVFPEDASSAPPAAHS